MSRSNESDLTDHTARAEPADGKGADRHDRVEPTEASVTAGDADDTEGTRPRVGAIVPPARKAMMALRSGMATASEPITGRVGQVMGGIGHVWDERPGARVRRVRRLASSPLSYLLDVHPEARSARPVQVGMRTIDVDEIAGTVVGGGAQRGGDFLPLKPFRGQNWKGRWQRLRLAQDKLAVLPPIDVQKYSGRYWVSDGHNRVALAKYGGQREIDANITELIPSGGHRTEPILSLAAAAAESRSVRTAGSGRRASPELAADDPLGLTEPEGEA